jgi:hypothetical protein
LAPRLPRFYRGLSMGLNLDSIKHLIIAIFSTHSRNECEDIMSKALAKAWNNEDVVKYLNNQLPRGESQQRVRHES